MSKTNGNEPNIPKPPSRPIQLPPPPPKPQQPPPKPTRSAFIGITGLTYWWLT